MDVRHATHLQGAKIALLCGDAVVAYLRDDIPHIPNPNEWDLPGGVRDGSETALDCALREAHEEFGIHVPAVAVTYAVTYMAFHPTREVAFFAAEIVPQLVEEIVFGDEGQRWRMMPITEFVARDDAVGELRRCLTTYVAVSGRRADAVASNNADSRGSSHMARD